MRGIVQQSVTAENAGRYQVALDKKFGITHFTKRVGGILDKHRRVVQGEALPNDVAPFNSLREAYTLYSGDAGLDYIGQRVTQEFNLPTFEVALTNVMNKLLIRDYQTNYRWRDIVTDVTRANDFRPQTRVRVDYVADLPDLSEDEPVPEAVVTTSESVSYSIVQKEVVMTVTRRAILNDDVQAIQRTVEQIGRAAWRTLAKRVWNKVINNDLYGVDAVAMFDAAHGNLGSSALSVASLSAARQAIFAQTEPQSNERLGLSGPFFLAVPIELEDTAFAINNAQFDPSSSTNAPNPWFRRFGRNGENIFANPLLKDANDWYLFDVSKNAGIIEVGFLFGQEAPTMMIDDSPIDGPGLYLDQQKYKLRHEYEASISDFRAAYKSVVA